MAADIRGVRRYAKLLNERIALEDKLKSLVGNLVKAEPDVIAYFEKQAIEQVAVEKRTLYLKRTLLTSSLAS